MIENFTNNLVHDSTQEQVMIRFNNFCEKIWSNTSKSSVPNFIRALQLCIEKNKETNLINYCHQIEKAYQLTHDTDILALLVQSLCDNKEYGKCQRVINSCSNVGTKYKMSCLLSTKTLDEDAMLYNLQKLVESDGYFPEMLNFISDKFSLSPLNIKKFHAICNAIIKRPDYDSYVKSINLYIKRLIDNKMYNEAGDIGKLFTDFYDFDITSRCIILYRQDNWEEYFYTACSNLPMLQKFYPYGQRLIECANRLGKGRELLSILQNLPQDSRVSSRTLISLQETLGVPSSRIYKNEEHIKTKQKLDIVFCLNNDYIEGFKAAIKSLVLNNRPLLSNFHFYISIDNSVDEEKLYKYMFEIDCFFTIVNIEKKYNLQDLKIDYGLNSDYTLDKSAYYRIFTFDYLIKNNLDSGRILYLDSDVLVLSDILELCKMRMEYPLYVVPEIQTEPSVEKSKKSNNISNYFNSGVLLLNSNHPETSRIIDNCVDVLKKESNLFLHDQCALNIAFNNNFGILKSDYNRFMHGDDVLLSGDICILHFSGRIKPWEPIYHGDEFKHKLWYSYYKAKL